jgi:D-arabinose 1-dehydrogenase-like Zn-dependent alcohol dehydrogenase
MIRVYGNNDGGGHAPYLKVPANTLVTLPGELSFETGAAISCGTGTAYAALGQSFGASHGRHLRAGAGGSLGNSFRACNERTRYRHRRQRAAAEARAGIRGRHID